MNTYVILGLAVILNAMANIFMKIGIVRIDNNSDIFSLTLKSITQPIIPLGIIFFILALICYLYALSKLNLSIAYPIMTSMGFFSCYIGLLVFFERVNNNDTDSGVCLDSHRSVDGCEIIYMVHVNSHHNKK